METKMEIKKCPNCGRSLTESEIYCYFCELDLSELEKKKMKQSEIKHE